MSGKPVEEMTFEEAMKALEDVVEKLESGDTPLEDSISLYERGAKLRKHCEARLKAAEMKVAQIAETADGGVEAKPAEFE